VKGTVPPTGTNARGFYSLAWP